MKPARRQDDPFEFGERDRHLFVPAVMGAGLLFSIATVVRDVLHSKQGRAPGLDRRLDVAGRATAQLVSTGERPATALRSAVRPRMFYLLTAMSALGVATYVLIGASYNYFRPAGYASGIGWVWGAAVVLGGMLVFIGVLSLRIFLSWPTPSPAMIRLLIHTPLGRSPATVAGPELPRMLLGWASAATAAATLIVVLMAIRPPAFVTLADSSVAVAVGGWHWLSSLPLAMVGETGLAFALAAIIGISTLRCRVVGIVYIAAVVGGWTTYVIVKKLIEEPHPAVAGLVGVDSFPSGHLVQATIIAGLAPLVLLVLFRRRWPVWLIAPPLALVVAATALYRVHLGTQRLTDVVAGILIGGTFVLVAYWAVHRPHWHRRCRKCPWVLSR